MILENLNTEGKLMIGFIKDLVRKSKEPTSFTVILLILGSFFVAWLVKDSLTSLLFAGKTFSGRSIYFQFIAIIFYSLFFSLLLGGIFSTINYLFPKKGNQVNEKIFAFGNSLKTNAKLRFLFILIIVSLGIFCSVLLIIHVLSLIDIKSWEFKVSDILPTMTPAGNDFRVYVYRPAENIIFGKSIHEIWVNTINTNAYPPLVTVIGLLFLPLGENLAYLVQIGLLIFANIVSLGIATLLMKKYILFNLGLDDTYSTLISIFLFFSVLIFALSSYPFIFSIERGNYDIYAILFALLSLWVLLRHPNKLWLQVILLSIATHLKIYPAILFFLLFIKHGKKLILPLLATNFVLLFVIGPNNAIAFFRTLLSSAGYGNNLSWIGNHSSYSFAISLLNMWKGTAPAFLVLWVIFTLIPILLWGAAVIVLIKRKYSSQVAILFFMVSVPIMDLVPTISQDYKHVILNPAVIFLVGFIIKQIIQGPKTFVYLQLGLLFVILLFIGRSYVFIDKSLYYLLGNKYLWSLSLEALMVWNIFRIRKLSLDS